MEWIRKSYNSFKYLTAALEWKNARVGESLPYYGQCPRYHVSIESPKKYLPQNPAISTIK